MKELKNEVTRFIDRFYAHADNDPDKQEVLREQFRSGYCYYFAVMLKAAFKRGEVCWAAPFGHFVWCDVDGTPYDVEGPYYGEAEYFIPEHWLGDAILDFKHLDRAYNASKKDIDWIIKNYCKYLKQHSIPICKELTQSGKTLDSDKEMSVMRKEC